VDLYRVDQSTDLAVADLTPAARSRVSRGITAENSTDARRILEALRDQRLPVCPTPGSGTATPSPSDATGASDTTAAPGTGAAPPGAPTSAGQPTDVVPTGSGPTTGTVATATGEPGVDCREAK
jgi:protein phosphatase